MTNAKIGVNADLSHLFSMENEKCDILGPSILLRTPGKLRECISKKVARPWAKYGSPSRWDVSYTPLMWWETVNTVHEVIE